jgi:hypothetical protein
MRWLRRPPFRRQSEAIEIESGCHRAADKRPVPGAFRRLPRLRRHDRLRARADVMWEFRKKKNRNFRTELGMNS